MVTLLVLPTPYNFLNILVESYEPNRAFMLAQWGSTSIRTILPDQKSMFDVELLLSCEDESLAIILYACLGLGHSHTSD